MNFQSLVGVDPHARHGQPGLGIGLQCDMDRDKLLRGVKATTDITTFPQPSLLVSSWGLIGNVSSAHRKEVDEELHIHTFDQKHNCSEIEATIALV